VSRLFWAASFVFCDLRKKQYFGVPIVVPILLFFILTPRVWILAIWGLRRRALFRGLLPPAFWPGTEMRSLSAGVARRRRPCAGLLTGDTFWAGRLFGVNGTLGTFSGWYREGFWNVGDTPDRPRRKPRDAGRPSPTTCDGDPSA
jgi:hypothetical protein